MSQANPQAKRKMDNTQPAATEHSAEAAADTRAATEAASSSSSAAAAASSSAAAASPAAGAARPSKKSKSSAPVVVLSEEERAAKRAAREARLAAVASLAEDLTPLFPGRPECRVLVYNLSKKGNFGTLVRTAVAFGATQIIVVGNRKINTLGQQATARFIAWKFFDSFAPAVAWIKQDGWKLIGIEIGERAVSVTTRPFADKTVFVLGNEGAGLDQKTLDACDSIVYIPQYGRGTASLNVATAAAIVLHQFAEWAQYPAHTQVEGAKFVVDESKIRKDPGLRLLEIEAQQAAAAAGGAADAAQAAAGAGEDCDEDPDE